MNRGLLAIVVGVSLLAVGTYAVWPRRATPVQIEPPAARVTPAPPAAERVELAELIAAGPRLGPSVRAQELAGRRVRLVGFMAQMELPPRGAFYLVPRPLFCDEGGGGTGDLPPESVLVMSTAAAGETLPFMNGALELTGTLEVGNRPDADGRVSAFRLRLDRD